MTRASPPPAPALRAAARPVLFLVALAALIAAPRAAAQGVTWLRSPITGFEYALTPSGTWEFAQQWARAAGANLVTIRSGAENEWLRTTFAQHQPSGVWIGLNDVATSREWKWASGEPVLYAPWNGGEPNNVQERHVLMFQNGGWNDSPPQNLPGIAERGSGTFPNGYGVGGIRAVQRTGTKIVDIRYNLFHPTNFPSYVTVEISQDGGTTYAPVNSITGAQGGGMWPGLDKNLEWRAGNDWSPGLFTNVRVRMKADDGQDMALIPGGPFEMGFDLYTPVTVNVSPFYILRTEVTWTEWDRVRNWAVGRGYTDLAGAGWADHHARPVVHINWFHTLQWLNAKSEMEGLTPVYFATADRLELYRRGSVAITDAHVNWNADGYRLPTDAEWEKAARGGVERQAYVTGTTISTADADFNRDYHPYYNPTTASTIVGYRPNGFALFDVAGNVHEWCWDWFSEPLPSGSDPKGPTTGGERVFRGGSFANGESALKLSARHRAGPTHNNRDLGFRYVRNANP